MGGEPRPADAHVLAVRYFRHRTGFEARCSCGAKILRPRGCNAAGVQYGLRAAEERFVAHVREFARPREVTDA
jgi:hypothetical protein